MNKGKVYSLNGLDNMNRVIPELLSNGLEMKLVHDLIEYCNNPVSRNTWMRHFIYSTILDVSLCNGEKECPYCGKIHETDLWNGKDD